MIDKTNLPENWFSHAKEVIERPLPPEWIEVREVAGTKLSYIGGEKVIRLLNEAFDYQWEFEILEEKIMPVANKPLTFWDQAAKKKKPELDANGQQKTEPQSDIFQVKGRLTVPMFGVREQYGSKILVGGSSEVESAGKSAATDCLKKCASMLGIGLELYEKKAGAPAATGSGYSKPAAPRSQSAPAPRPQATAPAQEWDMKEVERLKQLKAVLAVDDNTRLNPYVSDFLRKPGATFDDIVPGNIAGFNTYLAGLAEKV